MAKPDFVAQNQLTALVAERKDALTIRWLVAIGVTGAIAIGLSLFAENRPEPLAKAIVVLLWLAAVVLAVLSVVLPMSKLTDKHLVAYMRRPIDPQRLAVRMRLDSAQTRTLLALPKSEQSIFGLTLLFERPYMLSLALTSGIAFVGFVYGLLTHTMIEASPFLLGSLALHCWHYPRLTRLVDRGRKIEATADDADALRMLETLKTGASDTNPAKRPSRPPPSRPHSSRPPPPTKR